MNDKKIQVPATLNSISFTKDNGLRLGFLTQELPDEDKLIIQRYYQKFGYLLFSSNEFQESDIPKEQAEKKTKTPAQRLRGAIYVLHEQTNSDMDFEVYYRQKMNTLIKFVTDRLDK